MSEPLEASQDVRYVVEVYDGETPQETTLYGPFAVRELARGYARAMTEKYGLAYVRTVHPIKRICQWPANPGPYSPACEAEAIEHSRYCLEHHQHVYGTKLWSQTDIDAGRAMEAQNVSTDD